MENYDILPVKKGLIPYYCDIVLVNELFELHFNYNSTADLFTVDLYKGGELLCAGEPIVYGQRLWSDVYVAGKFPTCDIIPLDPSGSSNAVTYDNFGETVLLCIDNGERGDYDG